MMRFPRAGRLLLAAALTTSTATGCKTGFEIPVWNPFAKAAPAPSGSGYSGGPTFGSAEPASSSWTEPFKKMGATLSKPFKSASTTTKKDVTKPTPGDPVALATKVTAPDAALYVSLAKLQERSGNTAAAVEEYNKALDADPKDLPALLGLARLYDRQGRYDDALKLYRTAVELHPDNAAVMNDYGLCLARSGKIKDSATAIRRAVTLDPEKVLYRNNLATVLVELDRVDEAYQALVSVHGEAVAHYNVGFLLNKRGDTASKAIALKHFQVAAKLNPGFKEAQQWVDILGKDTAVAVAAGAPSAVPAAKPDLDLTPIATPVPRQEPAAATLPNPVPTLNGTTAAPSRPTTPYPSTAPTTELPEMPALISAEKPKAPAAAPTPVRPVSQPTVLEPADAAPGPNLPLNPQSRAAPPTGPAANQAAKNAAAIEAAANAHAAAVKAALTKPAAMPPMPDQVSTLSPTPTAAKPAVPAASPAGTASAAAPAETRAAARYPASRY